MSNEVKVVTTSTYVAMRDGVRLAVDICRPDIPVPTAAPATSPSAGLEKVPPVPPSAIPNKLGTVLIMTRYWRSFKFRFVPQQPGKAPLGPRDPIVDFLVQRGLAVVIGDVRGTGASEGDWPAMWTENEVKDLKDMAEWIAKQPWSNGLVGSTGISYEGSTACFLAASGHPSVMCVVPRSFEFDPFIDIVLPGGVLNQKFLEQWSTMCHDLDHNIPPAVFGLTGRLMVGGVRPVDSDPTGTVLANILTTRSQRSEAGEVNRGNCQVLKAVEGIRWRGDKVGNTTYTLDDLSVKRYVADLNTHKVPMQLWASWMDGTTARSLLQLFAATEEGRVPCDLWIGAFDHEGKTQASLGHQKDTADPPQLEQWVIMADYLCHHLRTGQQGQGVGGPACDLVGRRIHYFVMGQDIWRITESWPPADSTKTDYLLSDSESRTWVAPREQSEHPYLQQDDDTHYISCSIDESATTGTSNRWYTQLAQPVHYGDRSSAAKTMSAVWWSPTFDQPFELTGTSEVHLRVITTSPDVVIFAYLELVEPGSHPAVHYLTEGMLKVGRYPSNTYDQEPSSDNATNSVQNVTIPLLPTSVAVPRGWRLRLGLTGADRDSFVTSPGSFKVFLGAHSRVTIPSRPIDSRRDVRQAQSNAGKDDGCIVS